MKNMICLKWKLCKVWFRDSCPFAAWYQTCIIIVDTHSLPSVRGWPKEVYFLGQDLTPFLKLLNPRDLWKYGIQIKCSSCDMRADLWTMWSMWYIVARPVPTTHLHLAGRPSCAFSNFHFKNKGNTGRKHVFLLF